MTKNLTKSILFFLIISLSSLCAHSQNMIVKGTVYDTTGVNFLPNAVVMAVRIKDSLLLSFDHTDKEGNFSLSDCPVDTFTLIISYPKCDDKTFYIFGSLTNLEIIIPNIKMQPKSLELEEIVVYANKNPIFYRGDTLVYVADSFKVGPNAVVEDLLRKLPGIKVDKDGKLKSQGKEITQVLVDGDEFFGGDATIATKNLAADGVKSVEVYEKKAEDGGDETTQVLNLKLKEDAKKGYFGRVSGASDFQNFYQGEFLANKFNGTQKISVFALSSNTPRTGFGWADKNRFGLEEEGEVTIDEDGVKTTVTYGTPAGIPQTFKSGIYFSDKIGKNKKTKLGLNYTYTDSRVKTNSTSRAHYFLADTTYFVDDSSNYFKINQSHMFSMPVSTQLDSLTTISIAPKINFSSSSIDNFQNSNFLNERDELERSTRINTNNGSKGLTFTNETSIKRKFKNPKRELNLNYNFSNKVNETNGNLISSNLFYNGTTINDTLDQQKLNENTNQNQILKLYYLEPLSKKLSIDFEYTYEFNFSFQNKQTKNRIVDEYSFIDSNYSNSYETMRQQNRFFTSLIYRIKKFTIVGGVKLRNIGITNTNNYTAVKNYQNFNNILPNFTFIFNPSQNKRFSFHYKTIAKQPSINQIQPIPDNSNPNRIVIGNPTLTPSYTHDFNIRYNNWAIVSGKYVNAGLSGNIINNDFVNATTFDPLEIGKLSSRTENVNGNFDSRCFFYTGFPIYKKIIELDPGINANYSRRSSFINTEKNITQTRSIGGELELNFNTDSLRFSISGSFSYSSPLSSVSSVSNSPYTTTDYSAEINLILPWKLKLIMDGTYTMNGKRANGYNINYFILNAEINKSFLKTDNLIVSLMGNDIFNQNISANRYINSNVITDNKTQIISRYFLLKLTLKFNNTKTKEKNDNENW